ncbi:MAG TPA: fibronectin type III domain-containing protein [Acidimicrobiia bacterium]|nr:fibronectin type III domain-containing protein [Acidimicrobiia bacterium]
MRVPVPGRSLGALRVRAAYLAACAVFAGLFVVAGAGPAWAVAPSAPAQPSVSALNASIAVTFGAPFDGGSAITGYTASCTSSDGGAPGTTGGAASPITVSGLTNGKTYTCTVFATNGDGDGAASVPSAAAVPNTVPDAPAQPSVSALNASASVTFSAPFDGGSAITGYTASCTSSDGGAPGTTGGASSPITVSGLTNGKTYTCTVTASNVNGAGTASPASAATVPSTVPDAPAQPSVTAGNGSVAVVFVAPVDGGSAITGYTASCTSSDGGAPGTTGGAASPITVSGLTNGKTYTCTVSASNINGSGPDSLASLSVIPATVPGRPAQPTVGAGNGRIVVTFVAPSSGGSAITSFTAQCVSSNGGTARTVVGVSSPILVTGLTNGRTYTCSVFASNTNGAGLASPVSLAVVPKTVPSRSAITKVAGTNARIYVSFLAPFSGGTPITSYHARCVSADGGAPATSSGSRSPVVVSRVTNGYTYRCVLTATNALGTSVGSSWSQTVVPAGRGFRLFSGDGGVFVFGDSAYYGSAVGAAHSLVIAMTATRDNHGYWLITQAGDVFAFGDARSYGSLTGLRLNQPVVGATATPTGHGYWLVASDGGIFAFGDARFYGSTGNIRLNQPIVAMTSTATGRGYWFVAADGGLFAFGDARFVGSASGRTFQRVVGMTSSATGRGYWITNAVGQTFAFGDAPVLQSGPLARLRLPIMGIVSSPTRRGYWLAGADGGIFNFGDAPLFKWPGPLQLSRIIRGISR